MMRKTVIAAAAIASALAVSGCSTPEGYNAGRGALIGGTSGALIGGLVTGRPGGALAGAAIGAGSGAILGAASTPRPLPPPAYAYEPPPRACARWGYDGYGQRVCLKLAGYRYPPPANY